MTNPNIASTSAKRSSRTSHAQYDMLLKFMVDHEQFAHGRLVGLQGRRQQAELWGNLTNLLNGDASGPEKAATSWQKTWTDWKCNTRKKNSQLNNYRAGTGGGPPSKTHLTPLEEKLLAFLGPMAASGDVSLMEGGVVEFLVENTAGQSTVALVGITSMLENGNLMSVPDMPVDILSEYDFGQASPEEPASPVELASASPIKQTGLKRKQTKPSSTNVEAPRKKLSENPAPSTGRLEAFVEVQKQNGIIMKDIGVDIKKIATAELRKAKALEDIAHMYGAYLKKKYNLDTKNENETE